MSPSASARTGPSHLLLGLAVGAAVAAAWVRFGQPWEVLADGRQYLAMYSGERAAAPFAYRLLTPALARLLPWGADISFGIVTLASLILASGVIGQYAADAGFSRSRALAMCGLWGLSFPFAYYATTRVRADAPMLLLVALVFLLSRRHVAPAVLAVLTALGILAHELMLLAVAALWLDHAFSGSLTGGRGYRRRDLALVTTVAVATMVVVRTSVHALPGQVSYATVGPLEMFRSALAYSGGPVKHALRIYAGVGPVLLFAIAGLLSEPRKDGRVVVFATLFAITVIATFFAHDTLRVMELLYFPALVYAATFLDSNWRSGHRLRSAACLAVQVVFAFLVYGHLRTFEASRLLNVIAAGLSLVALVLAVFGWRTAWRSMRSREWGAAIQSPGP